MNKKTIITGIVTVGIALGMAIATATSASAYISIRGT